MKTRNTKLGQLRCVSLSISTANKWACLLVTKIDENGHLRRQTRLTRWVLIAFPSLAGYRRVSVRRAHLSLCPRLIVPCVLTDRSVHVLGPRCPRTGCYRIMLGVGLAMVRLGLFGLGLVRGHIGPWAHRCVFNVGHNGMWAQ